MESVKALPRQARGPIIILVIVAIIALWPTPDCPLCGADGAEMQRGGER